MTAAGKEPGTAAHQVFISYASDNVNPSTSDRQVADQICSALESQGIRCWIAHRDILPGDPWMEAITDAVDQTKIIILVFSANTEKSKWFISRQANLPWGRMIMMMRNPFIKSTWMAIGWVKPK